MTRPVPGSPPLDRLHHVAIAVADIPAAVRWYRNVFACAVAYEDSSWALLQFENVQLALVLPEQHPPHLGFVHPRAADFGALVPHRDGTRSTYVPDVDGNFVELLDPTDAEGAEL